MPADETYSSSAPAHAQGEPPWELIAERIDQFAAAWDGAANDPHTEPPAIGRLADDLSGAEARAVLVELTKLDIERRWQLGRRPRTVEDYVAELPLLGPTSKLPVDLIYEELQARMLAGQEISPEEIEQRFPVQSGALLRLLGGMAVEGSPTATHFADTLRDTTPENRRKLSAGPRSDAFAKLRAGDQIDDFQLIAPLGSGAFAKVFLARQVSMERMVAVKISADVGSEPQTLAQLDHPHIVRVYDQRSCADPPSRLLYMEVVPGGTLQDAVTRMRNSFDGQADGVLLLAGIDDREAAAGTPIPESSSARDWIEDAPWHDVVAKLGAEMAEGLAYAHRQGVCHRDLKPANVLLSAEARPKLADFNVSYNGGRADENPEDAFGGSLAYMSPEQLEACHPLLGGSPRLVRQESDIYALGVMLWELLTGRRPFRDEHAPSDGGTLVRLQRMIEMRRAIDEAELAKLLPKTCPAALRSVLFRCLRPEAKERYRTADELAAALRLCLNPRCWQMLQKPASRRGRFIVRWPILSVVIAGLIPNLLTACFNFYYNKNRLMLNQPELSARFDQVQLWINGLAFPLGIGVGAWMARRAYGALRKKGVRNLFPTSGADIEGEQEKRFLTPLLVDGPTAAGRILAFGRFVSLMLVTVWGVSGLAFPIAIGWGNDVPSLLRFHLHFFVSLLLCGAAATAYPYFLITALGMRYFVPALIRRGVTTGPRRVDLLRTAWWNRFHLGVAALVPMLGVLLVVKFGSPDDWALSAVSGGGLVGFGAMMGLDRLITLDMAALGHVALDEPRSGGSRTSRASGRGSRSGK